MPGRDEELSKNTRSPGRASSRPATGVPAVACWELVRGQWTAAAQRTKGLERLRDRHEEALKAAEDAAEERAVDDLVTARHAGTDTEGEEEPWRG